VEEKEPVLPLKRAAELALANFCEASLDEIASLDIPFAELVVETKAKRSEYITLDRTIRFGASEGCRACRFESPYSKHSSMCRGRFNGLIRDERIVSSGAEASRESVPEKIVVADAVEESEPVVEPVAADDLPFSADIPPDHPEYREPAVAARVNAKTDDEFLQQNDHRRKFRLLHTLKGSNTIFESACSETSSLGQRCEAGIECVLLTKTTIDESEPDQFKQLVCQVRERPGADLRVSLPCTDFTQWQKMNEYLFCESVSEGS